MKCSTQKTDFLFIGNDKKTSAFSPNTIIKTNRSAGDIFTSEQNAQDFIENVTSKNIAIVNKLVAQQVQKI